MVRTYKIDGEKTHQLERRWIREYILGGQDGLVNVLGLILGVASATNDTRIVIIAGVSALFAESISMGAVAYTSSKAARDFYESMLAIEKKEIEDDPHAEKLEIQTIFYHKGFRGKLLNQIVKKITSDKEVWVDTMMREELRLFPDQSSNPIKVGWVVFLVTVIGSLIPLLPFFFLDVFYGMIASFVVSIIALFAAGMLKAKYTIGSVKRAGFELAAIGTIAAVAGYVIGKVLEMVFG